MTRQEAWDAAEKVVDRVFPMHAMSPRTRVELIIQVANYMLGSQAWS